MNKQTTARSTGLARIRSLLAFRHENPVARSVSTLLAFAIAMLLVVGTGAAYADGESDPSAATTASADPTSGPEQPADASTAPPSGDQSGAAADPTVDPTVGNTQSSEPSQPVVSTSSPSTGSGSTSVQKSMSISNTLLALATINVPCTGGPGTPVGGFEIDGNLCVDNPNNLDWANTGMNVVDGLGADDAKSFDTGASKEGTDPAGWAWAAGPPNSKNDIETAWAFSQVSGGSVYAYFGLTNDSTSGGTGKYTLEYNQLANVVNANGLSVPNRSPGDLLFLFEGTGSGAVAFTNAQRWTLKSAPAWSGACTPITATAGWCSMTIPANVFAQKATANGTFFEGAINISLLFGAGNCSGNFGVAQFRSITGNSLFTSTLKDYVEPLAVTTPSTCGKIIINKVDENGAALGGATFSVSPNPDPTKSNNVAYSITDNDAKDKNPAAGIIEISPVDPGDSYTVTETASPSGYMIDNPLGTSANPQVVGTSQTKTFNFVDHRIWKNLTASKTASTSYRADYAWGVNKEISADGVTGWTTATDADNPLEKHVASNDPDANDLFYRLTVTEGARTTSLYKVTGTITVNNPADNAGSVTASVSDSLPGADCLVGGAASKSVSVPKGGSADVGYECTFTGTPTASQLAGTNTAHVSWDRAAYPQQPSDLADGPDFHVDPSAAYDFANATVTDVDKTVTVNDNQHTFVPSPWNITWTSQGHPSSSPVYSNTVPSAGPHTCSSPFVNTATLTGNGVAGVAGDDHPVGSDTAWGVICEGSDLTISRVDAETLTRTYPWSIEKSTSTPKVVADGGSASGDYTVTVTAGDGVDSAWNISGTITVDNPNDWESVDVTGLAVGYTGDNDPVPADTCTVTGVPATIAAGGSHDFAYSCNFTQKPDYTGSIGATVTWDAAAASTPTGSASDGALVVDGDWTKTLVNDEVTVYDDNATPGDTSDDTTWTLHWDDVHSMQGNKQELPLTIGLAVPDGGTCATRTNTVKIVGGGGVVLDADQNSANNSADVKVCNPLGLSITKSALGDFTRTYPWTIEKFIDGNKKSQQVTIDTYDHTFDYKVVVTPGTPVDSDWTVHGDVTVKNDNTDPAISPIAITSLLDDPSGLGEKCVFDKGLPDHALVSGETYEVGYTCTLTGKSASNTATVTWGSTGSAGTGAVPVSWNDPTEIDKSIDVFDDKVDLATADKLGTLDWDQQAGEPKVFEYSKKLTVPEDTAGTCGPDFVNTAWLGGTATAPTDRKDSTTARICVNAGTWTVEKVNVDGDGPVPTNSDITYRLTAHKTGGVNPKNVVLSDDLSAIAPYVDLPTQADLDAAAPAGSTAELNGQVITWTIDELGSTDQSLEFTVHVKADAYGVDLPNLVTSPGSSNCPNVEKTTAACDTDNMTPHYTLEKSSDAGDDPVLPPYLGADGTLITYTLTVHNDSDAPINDTTMPDEQVTDDLSDVLDNAELEGAIVASSGTAKMDGDGVTLRWTLGAIQPGGSATLTYQVRVTAGQWDETLKNVAHEGPGGDCLPDEVFIAAPLVNPNCTTTTVTPPYAQIQALKVDAETAKPLAGATFTLSHDGTVLESADSGADGLVTFTTKLQPGTFRVTETKAPQDYLMPAETFQDVVVTSDDLDNGEVPVKVTFADPPTGAIAVAKAHQELSAGSWVAGDGQVKFGDQVKYVMTVTATGPKVFHDVTLNDYVPGYNPADSQTQLGGFKGVLDAGSVTCGGGFTCTTSYDAASGLITWHVGDVQGESGTLEFVVRMPDLPRISPLAGPGVAFAGLMWNQASLTWEDASEAKHTAQSNAVTDAANEVLPPQVIPPAPPHHHPHPNVLPNTGGPDGRLLTAGLVLILGGGTLVAGDRRRRRRS